MIKKSTKWAGLMLLSFMICGCQQLVKQKDDAVRRWKQDYRISQVIPPLQIPENLSRPENTENYAIPANLPTVEAAAVSIIPPEFGEMS